LAKFTTLSPGLINGIGMLKFLEVWYACSILLVREAKLWQGNF